LEQLLPSYNDPLFSIILIIVLALIIALATYAWGAYKQQKEQGYLLTFLDKFDASECALDTNNMPYETHMLKPLTLLAKAFENTGEYPKSISIYLYLIKNIAEPTIKNELLERLGNTYLHAGFLERAKSIYVNILRKTPRNTKILYGLAIVYEMMQNYPKAKEILEPLELLEEDTWGFKKFLDFSETYSNKAQSPKEKVAALITLLKQEPKLYRQIISALFKLDTKKAWESIDTSNIKDILDVLWYLPNSQLDFDIISKHKLLNTLYYAKGYLTEAPAKIDSGIFALDILAITRQNGYDNSDLTFSYLCKKCKQSFPLSFNRCPNCMAIHTVKLEENIGKKYLETNQSLL